MSKKPNVIIFIVDGRRRYRSDDDSSKLDIMEEFGKVSTEFKTVSCSAPSSAMSMSAMFCSMPSYYLSRTYVNIKFRNSAIPSLSSIMRENGYETYGISASFGSFLKELIKAPGKKYWKNIDDSLHLTQKNNAVLKRLLPEVKRPLFLFMHYTRGETKVVDESIREGIRLLKENGLFDDSIFILTSDHGYPDPKIPRRKIDQQGHDLVVTDDNILVPFYIRYPGCKKGDKIKTMITHLDIAPTILDLLGMSSHTPHTFHGVSILPIIKSGIRPPSYPDVKIRIDSRYIKQPGRITAIRGPRFKYVYYHDKPLVEVGGKNFNLKESFYDLQKDEHEQNDLINSKIPLYVKNIKECKKFFEKSEKEAIDFQKKYLGERRFYILRQLYNRKDDYIESPSRILMDVKRQVNLIIYRVTKLLNRPYTAFR